MKVLLIAATTGYQVREFADAARRMGLDLVLATDRCHVLDNPWGDDAVPVRFEEPAQGIEALAARGPFDGPRASQYARGNLRRGYSPCSGLMRP